MENIVLVQSELVSKLVSKVEKLETLILDLTQKNHKEFLTHKEAQQLIKVSRNTLDKLASEGYFQRYQTGGKGSKIIFKRSELQTYLDNQQNNEKEISGLFKRLA